jgi:hypothetical protein
MPNAFDQADPSRYRHFWLKATPPGGAFGSAFYATLICHDDEREIVNEARDAISAAARHFDADWLVRISKPGCDAMQRQMSVAELFGGEAKRGDDARA